jgi:quinolinate synthase
MGIPLEDMVIWDYDLPMGGLTAEQINKARIILWKGFCSVHQMFKPEQIENFRREFPQGKVISHPEASFEVCQMSDYVGSTEYIIKAITAAEPNTQWLVGTELNLVNRLHQTMAGENKTVQFMSPMVCMCSTMFRIDPPHLAWVLENLVEGNIVNQISVPEDIANNAHIALQRMLDI